jgi:hypothetical protein
MSGAFVDFMLDPGRISPGPFAAVTMDTESPVEPSSSSGLPLPDVEWSSSTSALHEDYPPVAQAEEMAGAGPPGSRGPDYHRDSLDHLVSYAGGGSSGSLSARGPAGAGAGSSLGSAVHWQTCFNSGAHPSPASASSTPTSSTGRPAGRQPRSSDPARVAPTRSPVLAAGGAAIASASGGVTSPRLQPHAPPAVQPPPATSGGGFGGGGSCAGGGYPAPGPRASTKSYMTDSTGTGGASGASCMSFATPPGAGVVGPGVSARGTSTKRPRPGHAWDEPSPSPEPAPTTTAVYGGCNLCEGPHETLGSGKGTIRLKRRAASHTLSPLGPSPRGSPPCNKQWNFNS